MTMYKVTEFGKLGKTIEVYIADNVMDGKLYLRHGDDKGVSLRENKTKNGWAYLADAKFAEKVFGVKTDKSNCWILHDSAKDARKMGRKILHDERQKELMEQFRQLNDDSKITLVWHSSYQLVEGFSGFDFFDKGIVKLKTSRINVKKAIGDDLIEIKQDWDFNTEYIITLKTFKKIVEMTEEKIKEMEAETKAREEKRVRHKEEKFEEAKRTGKKVLLNKWTEPCNNPKEECDLDVITQYALPDGTIQTVRNHTW